MKKEIYLLAVSVFISLSFTFSTFARNLPDLAVTKIGTDSKNRVTIIVENVGRVRLPDSVWTNRNPKSPSITFKVNGKSWGGKTIWGLDSRKNLKNPGGKIIYVSNYVIRGGTRITATVDAFNQIREANKSNNTKTQIVKIWTNNKNTSTNNLPKGSFFNNSNVFNLFKIKTINTMQEHVQWVSETSTRNTFRQLRINKFDILAEDIISAAGYKKTRLRAYVAAKGNNVVVVFRGTGAGDGNRDQTAANAIITDANILMVSPNFFYRSSNLTKTQRDSIVHMGFNIAYNKLRPRIMKALQRHKGKNLYAFGHSLGGALATLFATDISINQPGSFRSLTHIVSGSPRVGDLTFARTFGNKVPNNLRIVINGDPVPTIPDRAGLRDKKKYIHVGRLLVLDLRGNLVAPRNISVQTKLGNFGIYHDNENYLKSVNAFMKKAEQNREIYSDGKKIIVDAARAERAKSN